MRRHLMFLTTLLFAGSALANVVGSDLQNFNPTSDGLDFVTVQSSRTLPVGYIDLGAFLDYALNPLPPAIDNTGNKFSVSDRTLSSDIHGALGLTPDWEVGMNISSLLQGTLTNDALKSYFSKQGLTDVRVNTKYRFAGTGAEGFAGNLTANIPQLQNDPFYGGRTSNMYEAELIWTKAIDKMLWALNGGYRFRSPGAKFVGSPYEPVGNEYIASVAGAYHAGGSYWTYIGEVFGQRPTQDTPNYSADQYSSIELLGGVKYTGYKGFAIHAGATAGLARGIASPDARVYAGVNWYWGRLWGQKPEKPKPPEAPQNIAPADEPREVVPPPMPTPEAVTSNANDTSVFDHEPAQKVERFVVQNINFESGSDVVPQSFYPYLTKFAEYLRKGSPLSRLTITGHTDSRGGAVYNQDLSHRRAEAVKRVMVEQHDIPSDKIETVGMGPNSPVDTNETSNGRSHNRRVEFQIERE